MRVAMVGASTPLTLDDEQRLLRAKDYIKLKIRQLDVINLADGRDFLTERQRYDAVIVHSIFHNDQDAKHNNNAVFNRGAGYSSCRQSSYHTEKRWAARLTETRARVIVVWELLPFALSGWDLGDLRGYDTLHRDHHVTVYQRRSNDRQRQRHLRGVGQAARAAAAGRTAR